MVWKELEMPSVGPKGMKHGRAHGTAGRAVVRPRARRSDGILRHNRLAAIGIHVSIERHHHAAEVAREFHIPEQRFERLTWIVVWGAKDVSRERKCIVRECGVLVRR